MKKILSVLLMLALVLCLAACGGSKEPEQMIAEAEAAMVGGKYISTVTTDISTDSPELSELLSLLGSTQGIPVMIDGDNMKLSASADGSSVTMTVYDGILYYSASYGTQSEKVKCSTDSDDAQQMLPEDFAARVPLGLSCFGSVELTEESGVTTVSCTEIDTDSTELIQRVDDLGLEALLGEDSEVSAVAVSMTVELLDGRLGSMTVSYTLSLTYNGQLCSVTLTESAEFDYDTYFEISAPFDAESYTDLTEHDESEDEDFGW